MKTTKTITFLVKVKVEGDNTVPDLQSVLREAHKNTPNVSCTTVTLHSIESTTIYNQIKG